MVTSPSILVVSGHNRYADDWHDMPGTSHAIACTLAEVGEVTVRGSWPATFRDLASDSATAVDLVVLNTGGGRSGSDDEETTEWEAGFDGLRAYLASGRPVLGVHQASNSLHSVPEYLQRLGGAWVPGTSMHPPIGEAAVRFAEVEHPIVDNPGSTFTLWDERYSRMHLTGEVQVLADHDLDGSPQPLVWAHETADGRAVYDALGHGLESYDSVDRRALLQRSARWLLD